MIKKSCRVSCFVAIAVISLLIISAVFPVALADKVSNAKGFDKGPSYMSVVPMKKTTFVNYDENSILDDYAYLAAIPTAVFNDGSKLFSNPLLFYQDTYESEDEKELALNARSGIDYFMEDWMSYCNGQLDKMTLINVPQSKIGSNWRAKEYEIINEDNPYKIASEIALNDWSYSDDAVVAVIGQDFEKPDVTVTNDMKGTLPACDVKDDSTFELKQTNSLNPIHHDFTVGEEYKYMKAEAWWDGILIAGQMIPTGDPDIQLYCKQGNDWMQASAAAFWNIISPVGQEYTYSHVYNPGIWRVGVTDFPTEGDAPRRNILGKILTVQGSLLNALRPGVTYHVDITMYPGIEIVIPDNPPFGCRNVDLKLTWKNPDVNLGFTILGPSGEAIFTMVNESRTDSQELHLESLGECLPGENYSISVFALDDVSRPVDFKIEYTWSQGISKAKADSLTSATEGAVLASTLNAPLLYTSPSALPDATSKTLYKIGVKNIYLVNIGGHLADKVYEDLDGITTIKENYVELRQIYDSINSKTHSNDVVFSTIDPWTYWYLGELKPAGETEASLFIGPAAYCAAHHGTPVIIIENHPELSSAVVWHNEFWRNFAFDRYNHVPSVAEMVLTGKRIYSFLDSYGFDKEGNENIITIADQYDIGIPWDRIFPGVANSGRFWGNPTDIAYWISRNIFYPALIFENPALQGENSYITGSSSSRQGLVGLLKKPFLNTLVINEEAKDEKYEFPVLCSFVTHKYRFNERASKYYGSKYQCADGLIPGETTTLNPIDQGVNKKYYGADGAYFPDIAESEIIPFYFDKGGYDTVFSTKLEAVAEDLNKGVILWMHVSHGTQGKDGSTLFWDPQSGFRNKLTKLFAGAMKEDNPWRGYDWLLGSTEEPDTMSMDMQGFIPFTNLKSLLLPATGMDWVLARKPVREKINTLLDVIKIIPFRLRDDNLYDGVTGSLHFSKYPLASKNSFEMEELLGNLHSVGFVTSICQTSNTYLQLMMIRHGSVFQVQDPWPTSWYGAIWRQSIPRDIILGHTVGEAYNRGISHVGTLYISDPPQWWWDTAENVVYFGDPELRMFVPSTEYSDANHWEQKDTMPLRYDAEVSVAGHMPFGATSYPNERTPMTPLQQYIWLIVLIVIAMLAIVAIALARKKKNKKSK